MAKVTKINVSGRELTEKELTVLKAVANAGAFVAATEIEVGDLNTPAIRSTMARLSKTHGVLAEKMALVDEKAVKTYAVADGIELPADEADAE